MINIFIKYDMGLCRPMPYVIYRSQICVVPITGCSLSVEHSLSALIILAHNVFYDLLIFIEHYLEISNSFERVYEDESDEGVFSIILDEFFRIRFSSFDILFVKPDVTRKALYCL